MILASAALCKQQQESAPPAHSFVICLDRGRKNAFVGCLPGGMMKSRQIGLHCIARRHP